MFIALSEKGQDLYLDHGDIYGAVENDKIAGGDNFHADPFLDCGVPYSPSLKYVSPKGIKDICREIIASRAK